MFHFLFIFTFFPTEVSDKVSVEYFLRITMNHTSKCEAHSSLEQVADSRAAGLSLNPNKNLINLLDRMFYV